MTLYFDYHPRCCSADNQSVRSSVPWPGYRTFLEVASIMVTWCMVTFLCSEDTKPITSGFSDNTNLHVSWTRVSRKWETLSSCCNLGICGCIWRHLSQLRHWLWYTCMVKKLVQEHAHIHRQADLKWNVKDTNLCTLLTYYNTATCVVQGEGKAEQSWLYTIYTGCVITVITY